MTSIRKILPLSIFLACLVLTSMSGTDFFEKGLRFYREQRFLLAIGAFRNAVEMNVKDPRLHLLLGNSYVSIGDYDRAIQSFQRGLESALPLAYYGVYYFNLAYTYGLKRQNPQAIAAFDRALAFNTNLTHAYWFKGMLYYQMRDRTNTIREWETYIAVNPTGPQSDNIRRALVLLRDPNFTFPAGLVQSPMEGATNGEPPGISVPLVDVTRALEGFVPEDTAKAEDISFEALEK